MYIDVTTDCKNCFSPFASKATLWFQSRPWTRRETGRAGQVSLSSRCIPGWLSLWLSSRSQFYLKWDQSQSSEGAREAWETPVKVCLQAADDRNVPLSAHQAASPALLHRRTFWWFRLKRLFPAAAVFQWLSNSCCRTNLNISSGFMWEHLKCWWFGGWGDHQASPPVSFDLTVSLVRPPAASEE